MRLCIHKDHFEGEFKTRAKLRTQKKVLKFAFHHWKVLRKDAQEFVHNTMLGTWKYLMTSEGFLEEIEEKLKILQRISEENSKEVEAHEE